MLSLNVPRKYDGYSSLSLEDAQRRKHDYVAEQIGICPGRRVLELGCGWGPLLEEPTCGRRTETLAHVTRLGYGQRMSTSGGRMPPRGEHGCC